MKESERFYAIYLAKDMTKQEMEEDSGRRKELIQRRRNDENVMIKTGQILSSPKIVCNKQTHKKLTGLGIFSNEKRLKKIYIKVNSNESLYFHLM